ncbi:DNA cytosine methyltransferase [Sphingomonas sp. MG17]|uniref:DNA (cytosine-5-)-methyltransferase n=1 Tax=Sphingomonas tagetis TaxID=2949092 RepID=A0A9X2HNZ1_9SPHN|nr:DNA cytosine methyltransferase [Sphingomonas tagetis]MCP3733117.1 DNA cytosine methyltransferase [Sphingomonas tagetis]
MFKVVDLFAGPGGLAEGFSSVRDGSGKRVFDIALSVEKEFSAFSTLRMRSFFRQFEQTPREYYDYICGNISREQLIDGFPDQWLAACDETLQLELGTPEAAALIDPRIDRIVEEASDRCILVGGPPCQAYSLVGRARNRGNVDYVASEDHRHFLYREYIRILSRLKPVAFVMENVKGFLSANVDGENIFSKVVTDLMGAGGFKDSYSIFPLVVSEARGGTAYVLRAEKHGVPQRRHRVILFGVRHDFTSQLPVLKMSGELLQPRDVAPTVRQVIASMPALRSRLSKTEDTGPAWREAVVEAFRSAAQAAYDEESEQFDEIAAKLLTNAEAMEGRNDLLPTRSTDSADVDGEELARWLLDPKLNHLPNHEARGHMETDLARYAFAATFAELFARSPKASEFPAGLAPAHQNWSSGKFNDRFRVQCWDQPSTTVTSHIAKDGHYFIHPDPLQCRSLTVREAARLQTFPDNYLFEGNRTQQFVQVGNAVPPYLALQIGGVVQRLLEVATSKPNYSACARRSHSSHS